MINTKVVYLITTCYKKNSDTPKKYFNTQRKCGITFSFFGRIINSLGGWSVELVSKCRLKPNIEPYDRLSRV